MDLWGFGALDDNTLIWPQNAGNLFSRSLKRTSIWIIHQDRIPQTPYKWPPWAICIFSHHHWNPVSNPESHVLCCSFIRDLLLPSRKTLVSWKHLNMTKKCSFITGLWMWLKSIKFSLMWHSGPFPFNKKFCYFQNGGKWYRNFLRKFLPRNVTFRKSKPLYWNFRKFHIGWVLMPNPSQPDPGVLSILPKILEISVTAGGWYTFFDHGWNILAEIHSQEMHTTAEHTILTFFVQCNIMRFIQRDVIF